MVSFKRGILLIISAVSLIFVLMEPMLLILSEGTLTMTLDPLVRLISIVIFVFSWASLWEDLGMSKEKWKTFQEQFYD